MRDIDINGGTPHFLSQWTETIIFEDFEIQTFDETRVWIKKEDGEGFVIERSKLRDCLEKFFQENM